MGSYSVSAAPPFPFKMCEIQPLRNGNFWAQRLFRSARRHSGNEWVRRTATSSVLDVTKVLLRRDTYPRWGQIHQRGYEGRDATRLRKHGTYSLINLSAPRPSHNLAKRRRSPRRQRARMTNHPGGMSIQRWRHDCPGTRVPTQRMGYMLRIGLVEAKEAEDSNFISTTGSAWQTHTHTQIRTFYAECCWHSPSAHTHRHAHTQT